MGLALCLVNALPALSSLAGDDEVVGAVLGRDDYADAGDLLPLDLLDGAADFMLYLI